MLGYLVMGLLVVLGATAEDCKPKSCPGHGAKLLPIPSDCSHYISCLDGQATFRTCPRGLRFDTELRACVRSDRADCDSCDDSSEESGEVLSYFALRKRLPQIISALHSRPEKTSKMSQRCIENSVTSVTCPEDIEDDRLLPHPDDCRLFYVCVTIGQEPACRDCPPNLHFNPIKKVCDYPEFAGCRSYVQIPTRPAFSIPAVKRIVNKVNRARGLALCEQQTTGLADLRPDPENCSKYYVCDWGLLVSMSCPEGMHFSTMFKVCDLPQNARCQLENTRQISNSVQPSVSNDTLQPQESLVQCEKHNGIYADLRPDPKNCSKYYVCDWGFLIPMSCPEGLHFSTMFKVCELPQNARCQLENTTEVNNVALPPVSNGTLQPQEGLVRCEKHNGVNADLRPDPKNCSRYFVCDFGFLINMSCPEGLHFSTMFKLCDLPQNARCQLENTTEVNDVVQTPVSNGTLQPQEGLLQCKKHNGIYADLRPDPENCSKYYVCDWGRLIPMNCPQGLHFNAVLKVCDSPYTANCALFKPSSNAGRFSEERDDSSGESRDISKESSHSNEIGSGDIF